MNKFRSYAFLLLLPIGCNQTPSEAPATKSPARPAVAELPQTPWASKPQHEWPQLVLTNYATFKGHSALQGASSFLIKTNDNRILAATARHLIGDAGGVKPEVKVAEFDAAIDTWRMFPRTRPKEHLFAERLGATGLTLPQYDWLILEIRGSGDKLPAEPLRLRERPVEVGEEVTLVGCPYVEQGCDQNVYTGKVTARSGDRFRYDIEPPVDIRGFSGAPILDRAGNCVGVMTVWFEAQMEGDKYLEAGGEDPQYVYWQLEDARKAK